MQMASKLRCSYLKILFQAAGERKNNTRLAMPTQEKRPVRHPDLNQEIYKLNKLVKINPVNSKPG